MRHGSQVRLKMEIIETSERTNSYMVRNIVQDTRQRTGILLHSMRIQWRTKGFMRYKSTLRALLIFGLLHAIEMVRWVFDFVKSRELNRCCSL